jgi:hypothetical protein
VAQRTLFTDNSVKHSEEDKFKAEPGGYVPSLRDAPLPYYCVHQRRPKRPMTSDYELMDEVH